MLGQAPVGGDLAAEYIEQRRLAFRRVGLQHIIARGLLRLRGTIIIERTHAGIGPDDMLALDRLDEIFAGGGAEIIDLGIADFHLGRIAVIVLIGGADEGEILFVGNGENDAAIGVLEEVGARIVELLLHDDMAALHEADIVRIVAADDTGQHFIDPRTGRIDHEARANFLGGAGQAVLQRQRPVIRIAAGTDDFRTGANDRAAIGRVTGIKATKRASLTQQSEYSKALV